MAEYEGARQDEQFEVVCKTPCVCKTPPKGDPVQYQISAVLSDMERQSTNVRFRGKPAATMDSRVTKVTGNEAGSMGGVNSTVNVGYCTPITASTTVRVNGYYVLYDQNTEMWMNCNGPDGPGNTKGVICFKGSPGQAGESPPGDDSVSAETPAEESFLKGAGKKLFNGESISVLAQKLPNMDWSSPGSVLGAVAGFSGAAQLGDFAKISGAANQAYSLSQTDWSNPAAMFGGIGIASGFGGMMGGSLGQAAGTLGAVAGMGSMATNIAGLVQTATDNPGAVMGTCQNLAGTCHLADKAALSGGKDLMSLSSEESPSGQNANSIERVSTSDFYSTKAENKLSASYIDKIA